MLKKKDTRDKKTTLTKIKEVDRKASVVVFTIFFVGLCILLLYHTLPDAQDKGDFMGLLLIIVGVLGILIRSKIKKHRSNQNRD